MEDFFLERIRSLTREFERLKLQFDDGVANGKSFAEVKEIYSRLKELLSEIDNLNTHIDGRRDDSIMDRTDSPRGFNK